MCPVGTCYFSSFLRRGRGVFQPACEHGFLRRRSREAALAVMHATPWRLDLASFCVLSSFKDLSKPFQCTSQDALDAAAERLYCPGDVDLVQRRHHEYHLVLPTADGVWLDSRLPGATHLVATHPLTGAHVDLSLLKFADDLAKRFASMGAEQVIANVRVSDEHLDVVVLGRHSFAQNLGKQMTLLSTRGRGSIASLRCFFGRRVARGQRVPVARYLGTQLHHRGAQLPEAAARVQAAEAVRVTPGGEGQQYRSPPNEVVQRDLQIAPMAVDFRILRLSLLRRMAVIAALLGEFTRAEGETGALTFPAPPLAHAMVADVDALCVATGRLDLAAAVARRIFRLWTDADLGRDIVGLDARLLRVAAWSTRYPPTRAVPEGAIGWWAFHELGCFPDRPVLQPEEVLDLSFVCQEMTADGRVCGAAIATAQALRGHRTLRHKCRSTVSSLTPTNQCAFCQTVFATREVARGHIAAALQRGYCWRDRVHGRHALAAAAPVTCHCDVISLTLEAHYSHFIGSHLSDMSVQVHTLPPLTYEDGRAPKVDNSAGRRSGRASARQGEDEADDEDEADADRPAGLREAIIDLEDVVDAIARLLCSHDISIQDLEAAEYHTIRMETQHALVKVGREAGRQYAGVTQGQKPEVHGLGPPGPVVAEAVLRTVIAVPLSPRYTQETKDVLVALHGRLTDQVSSSAAVRHFRLRECWDKQETRAVFQLDAQEAGGGGLAVVALAAARLLGAALPGGLVREVQARLGR
ncbi:unnamed protein product [Prorocentrum cordatum]|uniref:Uncharacterized protein n=1 Tax=Prorocentrum cordatum TaxID=2364126 RepID=A0ABN9QXN7_9DINO|nr:unnamed protein product [Polarella glacialis]